MGGGWGERCCLSSQTPRKQANYAHTHTLRRKEVTPRGKCVRRVSSRRDLHAATQHMVQFTASATRLWSRPKAAVVLRLQQFCPPIPTQGTLTMSGGISDCHTSGERESSSERQA